MTLDDLSVYKLSDKAHHATFLNHIVPQELDVSQVSTHPTITFVAAQPGAGKTAIRSGVVNSFGPIGAAVVDYDRLKAAHPAYDYLARTEQLNTTPYLREDTRRWWVSSIDWLLKNKRNIIIETTMAEPIFFHDPLSKARANGYSSELVVMAVPAPLSQLGILDRYERQCALTNSGRLTPAANHETAYTSILTGLADVEQRRLLDLILVTTRDGVPEFVNLLGPHGQWLVQPQAVDELTHHRQKQLSYPTAAIALHRLEELQHQLPPGEAAARIPTLHRDLLQQSPPNIESFTTIYHAYHVNQTTEPANSITTAITQIRLPPDPHPVKPPTPITH